MALNIDDKKWNAIVQYMDDEIREQVHQHMAPCSKEGFLLGYLTLDSDFTKTLEQKFGIDMDEGFYVIEDAEAGNMITFAHTHEEALQMIEEYEAEDKADGYFTPGFYAIRHNGQVEIVRS